MRPKTAATLRSLLAGIAGFVVYGGWAYFVNHSHGEAMGIRAGLTQGSYSFALTMSTTILMEYLLLLLKDLPGKRVITILLTSAITLGTAWGIHFLVGTPEIWLTILPGFVIGTVYTATYVMAITGLQNANIKNETETETNGLKDSNHH